MLFALLLAQAEKTGQDQNPWFSFLMFLPIAIFAYLLLIRPMKQQQKQQQALLSTLKKNDEVLTSAGIYGIVVSVKEKDDEVALKIDDNSPVRLRVSKGSIVRILNREAKDGDKEVEKEKAKDKDES